jgi:hypothetical protein
MTNPLCDLADHPCQGRQRGTPRMLPHSETCHRHTKLSKGWVRKTTAMMNAHLSFLERWKIWKLEDQLSKCYKWQRYSLTFSSFSKIKKCHEQVQCTGQMKVELLRLKPGW